MKQLILLIVIIGALVFGGAITSELSKQSNLAIIKTDDPNASVFVATPDKATALFLMVGFIVANVVVIGGILALIFYFLDRNVRVVKGDASVSSANTEVTDSA